MVSRNRDGRSETLAIFRSHEPLTTTEAADALGCSPEDAAERLAHFVEDGPLESKQVGHAERIWWITDVGTPEAGGRVAGATDEHGDGERTGVVVDDDGEVAWIDRQTARLFDVEQERAVGQDRESFLRSVLADAVADGAVVEDLLRAPRDPAPAADNRSFDYSGGPDGSTIRVAHAIEPIETGPYAGGAVEFFTEVAGIGAPGTPEEERDDLFRSLVQATAEYAIFMLDPDGHVISWNAGAERIKGYEESAILGEHFSTFYTEEEASAGVPAENLSRALEEGSAEDEGWRVRADGSRFWANVTITPIRDDAGDLRGFAKVTRDMTDRREWEQRLRRERNLLERTLEAASVGIGVLSRDGELVRANERAEERLVTPLLAEGDATDSAAVYDEDGEPVPVEERPHERVFETGEPVRGWVCQVDAPDGGRRWVSLSAIPIADDADDVARAVVCSEDVTQLKEQATRLAAQRDELEAKLDDVFERVSNAFFGLDDNWRFTFVNDRAEEVLGRPEVELIGASLWDELPETVDSGFETNFREAVETQEPVHFEEYYPALDSWFEIDAYPSESGLSVYFDDVTERKERERKLERYERIVENVPVGVYRNTPGPDGEFVAGNAELATIFDAESVDELIGSPVSDLYPDPERRAAFSQRLEAEGIVEGYELEQETLAGRTIWISVTAIRTEEEGDVYFDGVVQDVTDRKQRERELERYETLFEGSQDVNAIIEPDGTYSYLTPSTRRVLGYDPDELVGENAFDYVHPEDRDDIWDVFQTVVENPDHSPLVELRFRHADGSWVVLEAQARNFLDDPNVNGIVAYTRDATKRKLFEDTLHAFHESSRELIRAGDKTEVSRPVVDAATSVLDLPGVVLYRHDEAAGVLTLDEKSVEADFMREALPDFPADHSSIVGHTFCDGEQKYYADVVESDHLMADPDEVDMTAGLFVPLGDHAVLAVGWQAEDACDERTRQLIEILAANAEAAYTRVERERELEESRRRYSTLVDNFPNGAVALVDDEMQYVTVGGDSIVDPDATAPELEGTHVAENLSPELAGVFVPNYRAALDGEKRILEREIGDRIYRLRFVPVRDDDGDVFAAIGVSQDVTEQVEYEHELEAKARQQEVIADLGQRALGMDDLDGLFAEAVELVTDTLDTGYCTVFDLDREAEDLLLRAGIGLPEKQIGSVAVDVGRESQAGYTLLADEPIVVEDMAAEDRFESPGPLVGSDVESGISAVIGSRASPWGVLATHDTDRREFSEDDALFVQSVANILAAAIDRRNNEAELEAQREHLGALNNLNAVVRDINEALVEQSTREEIERTVCERLADSDSYQFAWTAEVDSRSESLEPRVEVGADGYLDAADVDLDENSPHGQGPAARAARSKEMEVSHDALSDPTLEPWRDAIESYGFRSCAAIPVVYQETLYGILGVYTDRVGAFADEEAEVVAQLGEVMGHAIAGIEHKQALMSDDVVEIDIRMEDVLTEAGLSESMEGKISFSEVVWVGDDTFLQYGTTTDGALETMEALVDELSHWEAITVLDDDAEETRFELELSEPPAISAVADNGGYIDEAVIRDHSMYMTIYLPPTVDVRRMVDHIQEAYASAELVTRQQISRTDVRGGIERTLTQELTDRQRAALEASFHAGFFEWPRESSGEEVAESLGVSAPTFHQHLRKAQQKLLETILS